MNRMRRSGFTLVELITTIAIVSLLSMITIPSFTMYYNSGKQTNRQNVAKSLFLAAQSRLTELKSIKNLAGFSDPILKKTNGVITLVDGLEVVSDSYRVYSKLTTAQKPAADVSNLPYVGYISTSDTNTKAMVLALLDPVISDKAILDFPIVIEYNIQTGAVLSVFYSEYSETLEYSGTGTNEDIIGARPYVDAKNRKQGYYGVDQTGIPTAIEMPMSATIYDGSDKPMVDSQSSFTNVLYAEFFIPKSMSQKNAAETVLQILGQDGRTVLYESAPVNLSTLTTTVNFDTSTTMQTLFKATITNTEQITVNGLNLTGSYEKVIWVLDSAVGNIFTSQKFSYWVKYGNLTKDANGKPQNIKAGVRNTAGNLSAVSMMVVNPLFAYEKSGIYYINTARHLNNVRYMLAGNYRQIKNIDLYPEINSSDRITNFAPIGITYQLNSGTDDFSLIGGIQGDSAFTGYYNAKADTNDNYKIYNLVINHTSSQSVSNVGLFSTVAGTVKGVSLLNTTITSNSNKLSNIGGIAGKVTGGVVTESMHYGNISVTGTHTQSGGVNAGGLVGLLTTLNGTAGEVSKSYNGGLWHATDLDDLGYLITGHTLVSTEGVGFVNVGGSYPSASIGGVVGEVINSNISNSYNNARVNIYSVSKNNSGITINSTSISGAYQAGGVVGYNDGGTISRVYNTNYVGGFTDDKMKSNNSASRGLVGTSTNSNIFYAYYIQYLEDDDTNSSAVDEYELSAIDLGDSWISNSFIYVGTQTYFYPRITNNTHVTHWERIEQADNEFRARCGYYEKYSDGSVGYWFGADMASTLKDNTTIGQGKSIKIVEDGYVCRVDSSFKGANTGNDHRKLINLDVSSTKGDKFRFSNNITFFGNDGFYYFVLPLQDLITIADSKGGDEAVAVTLKHASKAVYFTGYIQPYFAKAIFTNSSISTGTTFAIRTPRQLDMVDKWKANGTWRFNQEVDIELKATTSTTDTTMYRMRNWSSDDKFAYTITPIELDMMKTSTEAVVSGNFDYTYYGNNKILYNLAYNKIPSNLNNCDTSEYMADKVGVFDTNSGFINNVILKNSTVTGCDAIGVIGFNTGTVENIKVTSDTVLKGRGNVGIIGHNTGTIQLMNLSEFNIEALNKNAGAVVGYNEGTIDRVAVNFNPSSSVTRVVAVDNAGGVTGYNDGTIKNVMVNASDLTVIPQISAATKGGIAGINTSNGVIKNTLYMAKALSSNGNLYPITGSNLGINNGRYLSGEATERSEQVNYSSNTVSGIEVTSQELYGTIKSIIHTKEYLTLSQTESYHTPWSVPWYSDPTTYWSKPSVGIDDVLSAGSNPYPYVKPLSSAADTWLKATIKATNKVYYFIEANDLNGSIRRVIGEVAEDGTLPNLVFDPALTGQETLRSGLLVKVPRAGVYSIKTGALANAYVTSATISVGDSLVDVIIVPSGLLSTEIDAMNTIIVNDLSEVVIKANSYPLQ